MIGKVFTALVHFGLEVLLRSANIFVIRFPCESRQRAKDTMFITDRFDASIPAASEFASTSNVPEISLGKSKFLNEGRFTDGLDDVVCAEFTHSAWMTNNLSHVKTTETTCVQKTCHVIIADMTLSEKPFGDIAERIRWHRDLEGLTQKEYADLLGVKRATVNNWESGDYRLSLDGARALRRIFGLSLDFMIEGIDDTLSMTLRKAWRERFTDK